MSKFSKGRRMSLTDEYNSSADKYVCEISQADKYRYNHWDLIEGSAYHYTR